MQCYGMILLFYIPLTTMGLIWSVGVVLLFVGCVVKLLVLVGL